MLKINNIMTAQTHPTEIEIWKDIAGYEGKYQVSNLGRVRSLTRYVKHPLTDRKIVRGRVLQQCPTTHKKKYYRVMFGDRKRQSIHRLVATAFLPNPENKPCVNHKDGNPGNNHVNNLEWCTYQENERHSFEVLGKKLTNEHWKSITGKLHHSSKPVAQYKDGVEIARYDSATEAAKAIGCSSTTSVAEVCRGRRRMCHGYEFQWLTINSFNA